MAYQVNEMLEKGDPESIQKYVSNHLPSDQISLERIYKELLHYQPKQSPVKLAKSTKSKSTALFKKKMDYMTKNAPEEEFQKRTTTMIRGLKEKGFKVHGLESQKGLQILRQRKQVLVKPKITNAKLLVTKQAEIDRLIERFTLNSNFYRNDIEDVEINIEEVVDREMRQFIDRRFTALKDLKNKKNTVHVENIRYGSVSAKLTNQFTPKVSFEQVPSLQKSVKTLTRMKESNAIINSCTQEIDKQSYKSIKSHNHFMQLQKQSDLFIIPQQFDISSIVNLDRAREKLSKEQYDRYKHSYMKMMTSKISEGSKCKLNNYAKELLRDERKMRNVIDFSKK